MVGRIVEIADDRRHLFVHRGFMVVKDTEGERKELARIFHRSRATNEDGIALVCPKIQVSNLDQRAGNAEAKLYRRN